MTHRDLIVVVGCTALCVTGLACSDGTIGGAGGSSGLAGGSGAGGAAGRGGAGGGDAGAVATVLGCLQELYAACPETGACTVERDDGGVNQSSCYASGVRSEYTMNGDGFCAPSELRVYKPDGSLCYIEQSERPVSAGVFCEASTHTWRNAAGSAVATGVTYNGSVTIECSASGEKLECNGNTCPPGLWGMRSACQPGACP